MLTDSFSGPPTRPATRSYDEFYWPSARQRVTSLPHGELSDQWEYTYVVVGGVTGRAKRAKWQTAVKKVFTLSNSLHDGAAI